MLVGGLFLLGFFCGGRAEAGDGVVSGPTETVRSLGSAAERVVPNPPGEPAALAPRSAVADTGSRSSVASPQQAPTASVSTASLPTASEARTPQASTARLSTAPALTAAEARTPQASTPPAPAPQAPTPPAPVTRKASVAGVADLAGVTASVADEVGRAVVDERTVTPVAAPVAGPVAERIVRPVTERVVRPLTGGLVPSAVEQVVRPVGDLVERITDGLDALPVPPSQWPPLAQAPVPPALPEPPGAQSGQPGPSPLPAGTLPAGTPPTGTAPRQPGGTTNERGPAREQAAEAGSATVYGPSARGPAGTAAGVVEAGGTGGSVDVPAAGSPARRVPGDGSAGFPSRHSVVDNGPSRHGDAQAVAPAERVRPALRPGAAADSCAAATWDRHRDIPASPG
ncbi:hypothetical protein GCM10010515_00990 [Streptomyces fructofermentans]|uniref:Uncharacterized protein n=1 Tax=Streptomyces fructofermentans TaxID=152141 RepID=A0A918N4L0_9ACTN|nr:hypothetical protein GCM10010515_00990 [Streptomyces fructofermentans]